MGLDLHEKGVPTIDLSVCTGCGLCVRICPEKVLSLHDGRPQAGEGEFMGCIACGHCTAVCPTGAVTVSGRGMKPGDAFELPPRSQRATSEQLHALLAHRRSIRQFEKREIDRQTIDRILEMTSTAPMGIPPSGVEVVVVHGADRVQTFAADACKAFEGMARFFNPVMLTLMRPFIGRDNHQVMRDFVKPLFRMVVENRREGIDLFTYDAPAALLFHQGAMNDPADAYIAATYAMLAAESFGLGSCMLGTTAGLNNAKAFKAKYGIPPKNKIGLAIIMGYPTEKFHNGIRRRLASVRFA